MPKVLVQNFSRHKIMPCIAVQLELPIGTRKELAQEISEKLTNQWMTKYKEIMKVCNYTVGQADSDNTWASMQDNGSHIISFISVWWDPGRS